MVFNSPHSGSLLPADFRQLSCLTEAQLRQSEDTHVDALVSGCLDVGAPLMRALVSRAYVDLNREPFELDPRMFAERLPGYMNVSSPRVACGLGTIPRTVGDGLNIYDAPLLLADALQRIESIYRPYHRTLAALLEEAHGATGTVLVVDCHSMPASAVAALVHRGPAIDIVLGDRYGCSCDPDLVDSAEACLAAAGLNVVRNKPYAGGFITESHGQPRRGRHALQVEINRSLYMNESTRQPNGDFAALKLVLDGLSRCLAENMGHHMDEHTREDLPIAAE